MYNNSIGSIYYDLGHVYLCDRFAGALELWELSEDEHLLVNRFSKHDHDNIITSVSPTAGASTAVTGSMDCR